MDDELIKGDQQHNSDNAANAANNAGGQSQQDRIVNSVIAAPAQNDPTRQTNPAKQKPHKPIGIRIWRSLWRRRKWRKIRKSGLPPINWVEKSTLAVAFLVFVITSIQAMIYYWQADLMQKQVVQAQSANRRQLVIAAESNQISREALESVQRAFLTFDHMAMPRGVIPGTDKFFYNFFIIFQNSGVTPARIISSSNVELGGPKNRPKSNSSVGSIWFPLLSALKRHNLLALRGGMKKRSSARIWDGNMKSFEKTILHNIS